MTLIPPLLKGIKVYRNDPFRFDFILDKGDGKAVEAQTKTDATRLIKYFLASLTVPEKDLWVNLSPYEKDRIVPEAFGKTEMGRDLLAQDYILKQITASLIYPDEKTGKEFWAKVYAEAQRRYGTTDIPVDTFNKVWIIPEKATVYEHKDAVYVVESRLKVMLETDYIAMTRADTRSAPTTQGVDFVSVGEDLVSSRHELAKNVLREIIIPALEIEVNEGQNFATLRQVYNSLILATWYKRKVKAGILGQAYVDKKKTGGIDIKDKNEKEKIWAQYVEAFRRGAYNLIREEYDSTTRSTTPRKYFAGGLALSVDAAMDITSDAASVASMPGDRFEIIISSLLSVDRAMSERDSHVPPTVEMVNRINNLVEALGSPDGLVRAHAAKELLKMDEKGVRQSLFENGYWSEKESMSGKFRALILKKVPAWKLVLEAFNTLNVFDGYEKIDMRNNPARYLALGMEVMFWPKRYSFYSWWNFSTYLLAMKDYDQFIDYVAFSPAKVFSTESILSEVRSTQSYSQKKFFLDVLIRRKEPKAVELSWAWIGRKGTVNDFHSALQDSIEGYLKDADPKFVSAAFFSREARKGPGKLAIDYLNIFPTASALKDDVSIMSTSSCPFNCRMCVAKKIRRERNPDVPKAELFRRIDQVRGASRIRFVGPGETTAYGKQDLSEPGFSRDFIDVLKYASEAADEIYVVTNGLLIPADMDQARSLLGNLPNNIVWILSVDEQHAAEMARVQDGKKLTDLVMVFEGLHNEDHIKAGYFVAATFSDQSKVTRQFGLRDAEKEHRVTAFPIIEQGVAAEAMKGEVSYRDPGHYNDHSKEEGRTDLYIDMDGFVVGSNHVAFMTSGERKTIRTFNIFGNVQEQPLSDFMLIKYKTRAIWNDYGSEKEFFECCKYLLKAIALYLDGNEKELQGQLTIIRAMPMNLRKKVVEKLHGNFEWIDLRERVLLGIWFSRYLPDWWELILKKDKVHYFGNLTQLFSSKGTQTGDNAEVAQNGGIDLNPSKIDMATKNSGAPIDLNLDPAMLWRMQDASGVTPVIVGIHALGSLRQFLEIP